MIRKQGLKMRKGFTILELLVASLLLGMLMTILTMIFNQSSIAWRTGLASAVDMDKVRENVAEIREEADNAFRYGNEVHRVLGIFNEQGRLRQRACDADSEDQTANNAGMLENMASYLKSSSMTPKDIIPIVVGNTQDAGNSKKTYTVNVKCDGPDGKPNTWDDIWSWPDQWD